MNDTRLMISSDGSGVTKQVTTGPDFTNPEEIYEQDITDDLLTAVTVFLNNYNPEREIIIYRNTMYPTTLKQVNVGSKYEEKFAKTDSPVIQFPYVADSEEVSCVEFEEETGFKYERIMFNGNQDITTAALEAVSMISTVNQAPVFRMNLDEDTAMDLLVVKREGIEMR